MAPFQWMKRQILDDIFPDIEIPPIFGGADDDDTSASSPSPSSTVESSTTPSSTVSLPGSDSSPTPTPSSTLEEGDGQEEPPESDTTLDLTPSSAPVESLPTLPNIDVSTFIDASTTVVDGGPSSETGSPKNVGASQNSFLENKVLSGVVFGICGLVGLILLIVVIFFATRKARRNRKLEQEIISWDPNHVQSFGKHDDDGHSIQDLEEKGRISPSDSQQGHYAYALPNKPQSTNNSTPYSNYGQPVPIHIAFPATAGGGSQQPQSYRPPW